MESFNNLKDLFNDPIVMNYVNLINSSGSTNKFNDHTLFNGLEIIDFGTIFRDSQGNYPEISAKRMWNKSKEGRWGYGNTEHYSDSKWSLLLKKYTVSIMVNGFLPNHPIILDRYGRVLDGFIRTSVCRKLHKDIFFVRYDIDFPEEIEQDDRREGII